MATNHCMQIHDKDAKIDALEKRLEKLEAIIKGQSSFANNNTQTAKANNVSSLKQNIPNPFKNITTIGYTLPNQYGTAKIIVTDITGRNVKEINISGTGNGSIKMDASLLSTGTYSYSLFVNNSLVESKQMVLAR